MIASIMHWALTKSNISIEDALWNIPQCVLLLLIRQESYIANNGKGINLSDIEMIDNMKNMNKSR